MIPKGIVSTAWPRVVAKWSEFGVTFDPWECSVGAAALGKRKDGKYAATVGGVVLSIPRQVGKTFLVGAIVIAMCLLYPGLTVLWTAHHNRTATKTFLTLKGLTERPKVKPFMLLPRMSNGEQEIRFRNGSRIMFGAREQGFGRGFDEVDVEVFDEAQILSAKALEDMVPAANQSRQPAGALLFFMGTPPRPTDPGEEFTARRALALSGTSEDLMYVEFSADKDADSHDRKQWAKANPSFPTRTPVESMLRMRAQLTDDASFLREGLGIWDDLTQGALIPHDVWLTHAQPRAVLTGPPTLAMDVSPNRSSAAIAVAGDSNGAPLVEITREAIGDTDLDDHRPGVDWLVPRVISICRAHDIGKVHLTGDAAESFRPALEAAGLEVAALTGPELARACGVFYDGATTGPLVHAGQPMLDAALAGARQLETDHGWKWTRRKSTTDICPLVACTIAYAAHVNQPATTTFFAFR